MTNTYEVSTSVTLNGATTETKYSIKARDEYEAARKIATLKHPKVISVRIETKDGAAVITKSSISGKWIICREFGDRIEGDEMAEKRGTFATRTAAAEFARERASECAGVCSW